MSLFVCVLDASALLTVLHNERGADKVIPLLDRSAISAINWCETVQKAAARGIEVHDLRRDIEALGVTIVPFGAGDAEEAALLWPRTVAAGLSLADRACLALALREAVPAVTADHAWSSVSVGATVHNVR